MPSAKKKTQRAAGVGLRQPVPQTAPIASPSPIPSARADRSKEWVKPGYPVWNTKSVMVLAVPVLTFITILVYGISNRSFIVETERALLAISACLFLFFAYGLYSGVQIQHPGKELELEQDGFERRGGTSGIDWGNLLSTMLYIAPDLSKIELPKIEFDGIPDGGDDLVGCLLSIVLWVVAAIVITLLVWAIAQVLSVVLPLLGVALYWLFYRALKLVFSKSAECCKQFGPTLKYSLLYTLLFTGWLFVVLEISKQWLG